MQDEARSHLAEGPVVAGGMRDPEARGAPSTSGRQGVRLRSCPRCLRRARGGGPWTAPRVPLLRGSPAPRLMAPAPNMSRRVPRGLTAGRCPGPRDRSPPCLSRCHFHSGQNCARRKPCAAHSSSKASGCWWSLRNTHQRGVLLPRLSRFPFPRASRVSAERPQPQGRTCWGRPHPRAHGVAKGSRPQVGLVSPRLAGSLERKG